MDINRRNQRSKQSGYAGSKSNSPLSQLKNVTVLNEGAFSQGLKTIEKILKSAPIELLKKLHYTFQLKGETLHVYGTDVGIEDFDVIEGSGKVRRIKRESQSTKLEIEIGDETYFIVLHDKPFNKKKTTYDNNTETSRTTYPYRSSQWPSSSYNEPSESRGGGGGGER